MQTASVLVPLKPDLRERALTNGFESFSDLELVALLVGTGTEGETALVVAARLLDASGGLDGLSRLGARAAAERRGLGVAKSARIFAALELGRRAAALALTPRRATLPSFEAVAAWARPRLAALDHEEVWVLALDGRHGLISATKVAKGGVHGCAVTPKDLLRPAVRDGASGVVVIHNHPSGDPAPSPEDIRMTAAVAVACEVIGIELLDHVVVARGGAESAQRR